MFLFPMGFNQVNMEMNKFHDLYMVLLTGMTLLVLYLMISVLMSYITSNKIIAYESLEFMWTIVPIGILIVMAVPSMSLLYMTDSSLSVNSEVVSVTGRQWYWEYFTAYGSQDITSYMISSLNNNLDVDNNTLLPSQTSLNFLVSSGDVLHCYALPELSCKVDACPGRLNSSLGLSDKTGLTYGMCSEICGANHSFMPIKVEFC